MHVGDLDGSSSLERKNRWAATVAIEVHDGGDNPVAGATVSGSWTGVNGGDSCVTGADGRCAITKGNIKTDVGGVTFTVDAVTRGSDAYDPGLNHDEADEDSSDGTSIAIGQP
jgi:hypothetical protein